MNEAILCMDIGGTNCRIGLVDREGALQERENLSTARLAEKGFMPELAAALKTYLARAERTVRVRAVSMGFPATVDRERRRVLQAPNIPGLADNLPVCELLERALGLPVYLERDVNLLLAYDLRDLGLDPRGTVIGVYFGTGIGNSIYIDGRFLRGRSGVAGELGHIPQLHSQAQCGCGNEGCIEPLGGGRRLSELCENVFQGTDIKKIYALHGDTEEVRRQVEAMAAAVATEVNILDPDDVVIGISMMYSAISGVMRSFGDSKTPLMILIFACVVNILLDLLFVMVFRLAVFGVAVATIIAQGLSAVLSFACAYRRLPLFRPTRDALRFDRDLQKQFLRMGLPLASQSVLIALSCIALQVVVNGFDELVVNANVAVSKIEQLVQQPFGSLSSALAAYTGQNIGAGRPDRVRRGFRVGLVSMGVFCAVLLLTVQVLAEELLSIFVVDPEIIRIGATALRITSPFYVFLGLIYVVRGTLNGVGDAFYAGMNGVIELGCRITLPKPLTKIPALGMWGCFLCSGLTWMITGLLSLGRYLLGHWDRAGAKIAGTPPAKEKKV